MQLEHQASWTCSWMGLMVGCCSGERRLHNKIRPGTSFSSDCLLVCFVSFLKSPQKLWLYFHLWVQGVTLPFYNAFALYIKFLRRGGMLICRVLKSCRPLFSPDSTPELYSVSLEQMWVFVTLYLLQFHVFVRFLWQNGKRLSVILGLVTCYYYIYDQLSFATLVKRAFLLIFLFWYLTDSCVIAHLTWFYCWLKTSFNVNYFWIVHHLRTVWALSCFVLKSGHYDAFH